MVERMTQEARRAHKHAQNRELRVSLVFLLFLEGRKCSAIANLFSISESSVRDHVAERMRSYGYFETHFVGGPEWDALKNRLFEAEALRLWRLITD